MPNKHVQGWKWTSFPHHRLGHRITSCKPPAACPAVGCPAPEEAPGRCCILRNNCQRASATWLAYAVRLHLHQSLDLLKHLRSKSIQAGPAKTREMRYSVSPLQLSTA